MRRSHWALFGAITLGSNACFITKDEVRSWKTSDTAGGLTSYTEVSGIILQPYESSEFTMGCTPSQEPCEEWESPAMPVTFTYAFHISETEVTQSQFIDMMSYQNSNVVQCNDCPSIIVTWHEAAKFANAVSKAAGYDNCYRCTGDNEGVECTELGVITACEGYRLPTEAEWEAAARCGQDTRWAGSDEADQVAWTSANANNELKVVAGKDANTCGLFDMSGNVMEWTNDRLSQTYYTSAGRTDPTGPASGGKRVIRGGSWDGPNEFARVAQRSSVPPDTATNFIGFRLARTAP